MPELILQLTAESFEAVSSGTWLLDFSSSWCGPCQSLEPVLEELAGEVSSVRIGKVDVGAHPDLAERFGVTSVPTLFIVRDGERVRKLIGAKTKRQLMRALEEADGAAP